MMKEVAAVPALKFDMSAELHFNRLLGTADLPDVPFFKPVFGKFDLVTIDNFFVQKGHICT